VGILPYIIDQAYVMKEKEMVRCSILVKNEKIDYISESMSQYQFIRMDAKSFLLTPGHVMVDFTLSTQTSFTQLRQYMQTNLLMKGCTTVLAVTRIRGEQEFYVKLGELRDRLINSPIDYYLAVQTPLKTLTPSFVRLCKKNKIPALFLEITSIEELQSVPWGWIREALFPYFITMIPIWGEREKNKHVQIWNDIMKKHRIPHMSHCPEQHYPLSKDFLKKVGIYPAKGEIRIGGDVDYNLYDMKDISFSVEEKPLLDYHKHSPKVTIHKGKMMKAESTIFFRPGFGNECKVLLPGQFC
jgi:hypothetical protein